MKILRFISIVFFAIFFTSCHTPEKKAANLDAEFEKLSENFLDDFFRFHPSYGTSVGLHEYDSVKSNLSKEGLRTQLERLKKFEQEFVAMTDSLTPAIAYDQKILLSGIRQEIFAFENLHSYTRNPMTYARAVTLNPFIQRNFAPLPDRMKTIIAVESQVHDIFAAARENLEDSLAKPYVETAIMITEGTADFMGKELVDALKDVKDEALTAKFKSANEAAIAELGSYAEWLKKEKLPKAHMRYAIGKENYERMLFNNEMMTITSEEIKAMGKEELKKEQALFAEVAKRINPNKKAIEVFEDLKKEHPTAEALIPEAKKSLETIRQFLIDKKIISIPSEVRVEVKETPQFARATSTASMDTPGPFEKSTQAYYYITPTEKTWTAKQREEWLGQFSYYVTDVVSIHEAYPGHYVQFLHTNASNATKIEKIFSGYAFVEGWAHYTEKMMIEEGFGGENELIRAKYHLAQINESLLRLCRLNVSVRMHTEGMTLEEATRFFQENCYYDYKPAYQEALRGTFDPGYLSYTLGKLQILKLREEYKTKQGDKYTLQKFHDAFLAHGMPPIQLIREALLNDSIKSPGI